MNGPPWSIRFPLAVLVCTATLSIAHLEWPFGFLAAGVLGLLLLSVVLTAVALLGWSLFARRRSGLLIGACLLLAVALHLLLVRQVRVGRMAESLRRGDTIAVALSSFRAEHDRYPDSLPELVPSYLATVPSTAMAALHEIPFHYRVGDPEGFQLSFPAPAWLTCHRSESSSWTCDD